MGTSALVLGVMSILLAFIPILGFVSYPLAFLGIIFGIVAVARVKSGKADNKGVAISGLLLSILGLVLVIVSTVFYVSAVKAGVDGVDKATNAEHRLGYSVSSSSGGKVTVHYTQGDGSSGSAVGIASPWTADATVKGNFASVSASTYTEFGEDFNKADGLTCSIVDKDTGKTLVTNSIPPSPNGHVDCTTVDLNK
ncbi:hypothetical protein D5S17_06760 [Pseudonocardiaceae bacterium YIM PH 21723]|nr:hypothetical protein D5S17_06760 [Pseudonocardiaceae bacterium YIM PH 21723]